MWEWNNHITERAHAAAWTRPPEFRTRAEERGPASYRTWSAHGTDGGNDSSAGGMCRRVRAVLGGPRVCRREVDRHGKGSNLR
jgi:hypothetical protein